MSVCTLRFASLPVRPISVVTVFDRVGAEFSPLHTGFGAGPDNQTIPDIGLAMKAARQEEQLTRLR